MAKKISPFDIVNHINFKTNLDFDTKDYLPWIVNKAFSFNQVTVLFANVMNKNAVLDNDMQHDFYYQLIPKGKKEGNWEKKTANTEIVEIIRHIYSCNRNVAAYYASLLTEEQQQKLRDSKGGKS